MSQVMLDIQNEQKSEDSTSESNNYKILKWSCSLFLIVIFERIQDIFVSFFAAWHPF